MSFLVQPPGSSSFQAWTAGPEPDALIHPRTEHCRSTNLTFLIRKGRQEKTQSPRNLTYSLTSLDFHPTEIHEMKHGEESEKRGTEPRDRLLRPLP